MGMLKWCDKEVPTIDQVVDPRCHNRKKTKSGTPSTVT